MIFENGRYAWAFRGANTILLVHGNPMASGPDHSQDGSTAGCALEIAVAKVRVLCLMA
jgi:hypothetical protein